MDSWGMNLRLIEARSTGNVIERSYEVPARKPYLDSDHDYQ